jgi:bacteriorhodopsin
MNSVAPVLALVAVYLALVTPVYVIGRRLGVRKSWVAFVPIFGVWIVLLESVGQSGWAALAVLIPTLGVLALLLWIAVAAPPRHGRSRLWTLAFIVPGLNFLAYWAYALTLERRGHLAFAS